MARDTAPRTAAGQRILDEWLLLRPEHPPNTARIRDMIVDLEAEAAGAVTVTARAIREAEAATPAADDALRAALTDLVECVTALENRSIRSGGEFHVWAEERMVTESRDRARAALATPPPAPADDALRLLGRLVRWWHTEGTLSADLEPLVDEAQAFIRRHVNSDDPYWDLTTQPQPATGEQEESTYFLSPAQVQQPATGEPAAQPPVALDELPQDFGEQEAAQGQELPKSLQARLSARSEEGEG